MLTFTRDNSLGDAVFRSLLLILALLFPATAHAEWYVAETDHFVVYSESNARQTEEFASRLERFARAMRFMQNMPIEAAEPSNRLTIYRWGDVGDISRLYSPSRNGVAGFFIPRASGSVAFVPARESYTNSPGTRTSDDTALKAETILFH